MTLWNLIRDFFVEHIFGGWTSSGDLIDSNIVGRVFDNNGSSTDMALSGSYYIPVGFGIVDNEGTYAGSLNMTLGDWLSTTFTIITLILLVIFLYIFVKWIFKLFSGLLK